MDFFIPFLCFNMDQMGRQKKKKSLVFVVNGGMQVIEKNVRLIRYKYHNIKIIIYLFIL